MDFGFNCGPFLSNNYGESNIMTNVKLRFFNIQ